jgi:hypothetical protein
MNRIWIYQSKRPLTNIEQTKITAEMQAFVEHWAAHNVKLDARFEILHSHFIILSVNQEEVMASGCSIDDSMHFMQDLDRKYNLSLFDRQLMAYVNETGDIKVCSLNEISTLYNSGQITETTYIFNNIIHDSSLLDTSWKIPFKESGFKAFL